MGFITSFRLKLQKLPTMFSEDLPTLLASSPLLGGHPAENSIRLSYAYTQEGVNDGSVTRNSQIVETPTCAPVREQITQMWNAYTWAITQP